MTRIDTKLFAVTAILASLLMAVPSPAPAQEDEGLAERAATDTSDKSGTNPVNFQRDLRFYNEYSWLNEDNLGDGNQNVLTMEYRQPLFKGEWQFRLRAPSPHR